MDLRSMLVLGTVFEVSLYQRDLPIIGILTWLQFFSLLYDTTFPTSTLREPSGRFPESFY